MNKENKFALLIDADNISPKYIEIIVRETEAYGVASIRRIYGDWTDLSKGSWKNCLLDNSLSPIQQYNYTSGKNSSDSAMIIDAMDILYENIVDGFIIATSDSDFTRLAVRLRESGKRVIGMGESKTPSPFVKACEQFKTLDVLYKSESKNAKEHYEIKNEDENESKPEIEKPILSKDAEPITSMKNIKRTILGLLEEKSDEDGWMFLGNLGNMIIKRYPDFDCRNYGFVKFGKMIESFDELQTKKEKSSNGLTSLVYVSCKKN
ncbi:MAG: NYN domain-containing protein [Velocimicrobium sp.]